MMMPMVTNDLLGLWYTPRLWVIILLLVVINPVFSGKYSVLHAWINPILSGNYMYHLLLTLSNSAFCPQNLFMALV
jgi:hypothetical protein